MGGLKDALGDRGDHKSDSNGGGRNLWLERERTGGGSA